MANLKMIRAGCLHTYDTEEQTLTISWDVTGRCPYNCSYCYERNNLQKRKMEPRIESLTQGISNLKQLLPETRKVRFYLFGGEPTAHRDFLPFIDSVVKLKTCYNLFTYNEERAYGGTSKT